MVCNDSSSRSYLILDRFFIDLALASFLGFAFSPDSFVLADDSAADFVSDVSFLLEDLPELPFRLSVT